MKFKEIDKHEFDTFVLKYNNTTPFQTSFYAETMNEFEPYYLGLYDNELVAASLVLVKTIGKFKYGYVPRGFIMDYNNYNVLEEFTKGIKKFLGSKKVVAIKISPMVIRGRYDSNYTLLNKGDNYDSIFDSFKKLGYRHLGYNNFFEAMEPRYNAIIELDGNYFNSFIKMRKQFKTKVRSAEKNGVRIYHGDSTDLENLYDQAKGKYPNDFNYYKNLYDNFNNLGLVDIYYAKLEGDEYSKNIQEEYLKMEKLSNNINNEVLKRSNNKLLDKKIAIDKDLNISKKKLSNTVNFMNKYPDGIVIASVLVIKTGNKVTVMIDSFDKRFKSLNAKHLIIWKLIEKYSEEGYKYFDLGGITNKVDNTNKYYGLNSYKLGFGSNIYEYIGDLELVTNKPLHLMYINSGSLRKK